MKLAVFHNQEERSVIATQRLHKILREAQIIVDEKNPEIVISIGGDGTLLAAFHKYEKQLAQVMFVGIHTGHLGFYTDWRDFELAEFIQALQDKKAKTQSIDYPLLEVYLECGSAIKNEKKRFLALNESTIRRHSRTLVGDIYIGDEFFESFRGDGLSISTPTGSTAYNKSIGGAVIHPSINALQLTEIASLNNRIFRTLGSPMVIASHEWIKINLTESDGDDYLLTVDQEMINSSDIKSLIFRIAPERVKFKSFCHLHFWERVRESFIADSEQKNAF